MSQGTGTLSFVPGGEREEVDRRLVVVVDGTGDQALLRRYWAGSIDDSGKLVYSESVAAIAEDLGGPTGRQTRQAAELKATSDPSTQGGRRHLVREHGRPEATSDHMGTHAFGRGVKILDPPS